MVPALFEIRQNVTWSVGLLPVFAFLHYYESSYDTNTTEKFVSKYSKMNQVKFFKGCFPQTLLGPFLNTLTNFSNTK